MPKKPFIYQRRRPEDNLLYQTVAAHLNTFLAELAEEGKSLPKHVEQELWSYLRCGVLAYGFLRLKCEGCKAEQFVAFSCKKRGFCPSCGAKRMTETAHHLVDNILPNAKVRQYVLSVPVPLRYWMASNNKLLAKIHRIFASEIEKHYLKKHSHRSRSGSICFVQRFGSALNLNVHFHMLQLEGIYELKETGYTKFKKSAPPTDHDIKVLVATISQRVIRQLKRLRYLNDTDTDRAPGDSLLEEEPTYASCMSASLRHLIALGERRGQRVRFLGKGFGYEEDLPELRGRLCAQVNGFSLHAGVAIPRHRRDQLIRLIGYVGRSSVCLDRLSLTPTGDIKYQLKKPWKNGVTHVVLSPTELIEKLCSLVPLPYLNLVRYWGVFAPNSKYRASVIPGLTRAQIKEKETQENNKDPKETPNLLKKSSWAKLLAKVFQMDISKCRSCGEDMKFISSIEDPMVIKKILTHCGLAPIPPPIAPALYQERLIS